MQGKPPVPLRTQTLLSGGPVLTSNHPAFDLSRFSRAIEIGAVDYLVTQYAPGAQIRIVDPDHPPDRPTMLVGQPAIKAWRQSLWIDYALHTVVKQLATASRVMFVEQRVHYDGISVVATNTAEIQQGLITAQHTIVVWDDDRRQGGLSAATGAVDPRDTSSAGPPPSHLRDSPQGRDRGRVGGRASRLVDTSTHRLDHPEDQTSADQDDAPGSVGPP